jgi:DNA-binding HxlR family transcriptional regulator
LHLEVVDLDAGNEALILRDFFLHGPRRFQQLQDWLKGIAPTTLSERLRTLEENGVVERRFYSMSPPAGRVRSHRKGSRRTFRPVLQRIAAVEGKSAGL